ITGGSGFMGINLIRFLIQQGYNDIRVIDIVEFEYPEINQIDFLLGDIRDTDIVKEAMKNVNWVVHCAAALPLYSKEDIYSTDVQGTRNLLIEALDQKVERFVYTSSTAVYGIPDHHPINEEDQLVGVGYYGHAKIEAEEVCLEFREKGIVIPIVRPKSFIGPERLGVFALLYDWAKDGKNFPMIGSGLNKYQLLDVEDLCRAVLLMLIKDADIVNDTFNIGAKIFATMKEDYQAVLDDAGFGKNIIPFPVKPMIWALRFLELLHISPLYKWVYETAFKDSYVSIEKAENKLGYVPKFSNEDALLRNYHWYINNLENFDGLSGISHRVPWRQGALKIAKMFF
ncbi:MAG: NAD-dependent epimerase/dehydratase family protein, partial [Bacteroidetes bacterium]|nr:NAD-dependent epimerase/dehydratase family protein [Bacteroidota bacterium]